MRSQYDALLEEIALSLGLDPRLLQAFSDVESAQNPYAMRFEPRWGFFFQVPMFAAKLFITTETETQLQSFSYGLLQVMGSVARELGYDGPLQILASDARMGAMYGAMKLKQCLEKFDKATDAIAAYNAGTPRRGRDGRYINQTYVDKVLSAFAYRGGKL